MGSQDIDTIDEAERVYHFLAAATRANVCTSETAVPRLLKERRQKKGRTLFYGCKILNLFQPDQRSSRDGGGKHESPDVHPRRLHEMHGKDSLD